MGSLSTNLFITKARQIQASLAANPVFNVITPQPSEIIARLDELAVLQAECNDRNYKFVAYRDDVRAIVERMLDEQCTFVNAIAKGDTNTLALSGFELNKVRSKRQVPPQGQIKKITVGDNEGEIVVHAKASNVATFYKGRYNGGNIETSTSSRIIMSNIPVGISISVQVMIVNSSGRGAWSAPFEYMLGQAGNTENNNTEITA